MSQRRTRSQSESLKAAKLEQIHEQLQQSRGDADNSEEIDSEELAEAVEVLRMIDRVQRRGRTDSTAPPDNAESTRVTRGDLFAKNPASEKDWLQDLPSQLGHFEILELLGQGGHGLVLLAEDVELKRKVALKLPRPEAMLDSSLKKRFVLEAEVAAALSHPNIIPVFEAGLVGPLCFIAYAYCPGEPLSHWLKRRGRSVPTTLAARIVATLARAIHHAHVQGVVHRDLKPSNVMLVDVSRTTEDFDPEQCCRITDFGLAKLESSDQELTRSGAIVGTTAYLSPEQAEGGETVVGPPADIFSLGTMLYELLTGKPPFLRSKPLDTLTAIRVAEPTRPRKLDSRIPGDLEAICLKCLEKSPTSRYPSAIDLAHDLQLFLDGKPVQARKIGSIDRALRWCRRNPIVAMLVAIAGTLFVTGTVAVTLQWRQAVFNLGRAEHEFARAEKNLEQAKQQGLRASRHLRTAQASIDELLNQLATELSSIPQMEETQRRLLVSALSFQERLLDEESDDPLVQLEAAEGQLRVARINRMLGNLDEAQAACDKALKHCDNVFAQRNLDEAGPSSRVDDSLPDVAAIYTQAYRARAGVFQDRKELRAAQNDFEQAVDYARRNLESCQHTGPVYVGLAGDLRNVARIASQTGQSELADKLFPAALKELEKIEPAYAQDPLCRFEKVRCLNSLAIHLRLKGKNATAATLYQQALQLLQVLAKDSPQDARIRKTLAETHFNMGNFYLLSQNQPDEAAISYLAAIDAFSELTADFPMSPIYREQLGKSYFAEALLFKRTDELDLSKASYLKAIEIDQRLADEFPDNPGHRYRVSSSQSNLSTVYLAIGQLDEAQRTLDDLIRVRQALVTDYPDITRYRVGLAISLNNVGSLNAKQQRYEKAAEYFLLAIDHQRQALEANPEFEQYRQYLAQDIEALAQVRLLQGEYGEADDLVAKIPELSLDDPRYCLMTAAFYAKNLATISEAEQLSEAESAAWLTQYRDRTFEMLALAQVAGLQEPSMLDQSSFDAVRDDPRFEALLGELVKD